MTDLTTPLAELELSEDPTRSARTRVSLAVEALCDVTLSFVVEAITDVVEVKRRVVSQGDRDDATCGGLRVQELVDLEWSDVDLDAGRISVRRVKGSDDSVQPLTGVEIRALRRLRREQQPVARHVFTSERGDPFTTNGFFKLLRRAAESIDMPDVHPHLLRHGFQGTTRYHANP